MEPADRTKTAEEKSIVKLFSKHFQTIQKAIRAVSFRYQLSAWTEEEFTAYAHLRLLEDDRGILRKYAGYGSMANYLRVAIGRLFLDFRAFGVGRWQASAAATALGPEAVELETLVYRDGYSLDEAIETLKSNHQVRFSRPELQELALAIPARSPRVFEPGDAVETIPSTELADRDTRLTSSRELARKIEVVLDIERAGWPREDRVLLELRFEWGLKISEISRELDFEQRPLYRRFEKLLGRLREALHREGLDSWVLEELISVDEAELSLFDRSPQTAAPLPTADVESALNESIAV